MQFSLFDACRLHRLRFHSALLLGAIFLLYAAVGTPLDLVFSSNVAYSGTALVSLWSAFLSLLNYLFYWVAFAYLLYSVIRFPLRSLGVLFGIYASAVVLRYASSLFAYYCVMGFSEMRYFVSEQLGGLIFSIVMDLFQFSLAFLICFLVFRRAPASADLKNPASRWLPFTSFFSFSNLLQRSSFFVSLIPAGISLLQRLYFDIFVFGAPMDTSDLLVMVIYYLSDVASAVIGYLVIELLLDRMFFSDERAREIAEKD